MVLFAELCLVSLPAHLAAFQCPRQLGSHIQSTRDQHALDRVFRHRSLRLQVGKYQKYQRNVFTKYIKI